MLSKMALQDIARLTKLKLHQQEKHYIQTVILNSLYASVTDELVFKGGTALFFSMGLPRFSEDLDFTAVKDIDFFLLAERIHHDLELVGIENEIRKKERTSVSFSFKIAAKGPLFTQEIERCFVDVEISTREDVAQKSVKEISPVYSDIPPFTVLLMGEEEMAAEKIRAMMTRSKARDIYDLYFLLQKNVVVSSPLIGKKLAYYQKKFTLREFTEKLNEKESFWEAELRNLVLGILPPFAEVKKLILAKMGRQSGKAHATAK